ncbi:MAG TPA: 1-acyl-sn-glycerol-3-phosphate acyltransferase [Kofleriaceae bacterium]|nr:1-acyl-sn-glycerol-3-phosphate acyltransferase [Kofleriaceae bacterium]
MWSELEDWLRRAQQLVPADDRSVLLSPPRLVARFTKFALQRWRGKAGRVAADDVHARDPELVRLLCDMWRVLARYYFRLRVIGVDNVPASGPVLLVGNHCGGFLPSEGFFAALAITNRFGPERALYALAHDFLFEDPTLRRYAARLGILRASHESAHHAFEAGGIVVVYPGSDMDTFRPFHDRGKIVLAGRKGFLKLALHEHVPIVPVVDAGTHEQLVVLARGDRLAKLTRAHRWARTEVLPIVLSFPWGLTSGFVPYLPLPAQSTLSFLPPMTWPDADPDNPDDLDRCYRDVERVMQVELDRLMDGRRFLLGQKVTPPPRSADATPRRETPPGSDRDARASSATRESTSP